MHTAERRLCLTWRKITATTSIASGLERTSPVLWNRVPLHIFSLQTISRHVMLKSVQRNVPLCKTYVVSSARSGFGAVKGTACQLKYSWRSEGITTPIWVRLVKFFNFPHSLWFTHLVAFMYQGELSYVHTKPNNFCADTNRASDHRHNNGDFGAISVNTSSRMTPTYLRNGCRYRLGYVLFLTRTELTGKILVIPASIDGMPTNLTRVQFMRKKI